MGDFPGFSNCSRFYLSDEVKDLREELDRTQTQLRNLEEFVWEEVLEPNCTYKEEGRGETYCNAGLIVYCAQDGCPRIQSHMRRK